MKIQCPECKTEYQVNEEKIPSRGVYTRCKNCMNRFMVQKETGSKGTETDQAAANGTYAEEQRIDQYIEQEDLSSAARLLFDLIKRYATEKNFTKAETLRDKLYRDLPLALDEIVKAGTIIEEEKKKSMDQQHLETWHELYESLTPDETIELYFSMKEIDVKPGQKVFEQGQRNSNLYFVQAGLLRLFYIDPINQKQIVLKKLSAGDIANANPFFNAALCAQTLVALSEAKLTYLEKDILTKWKEEFPGIRAALNHFCRDRADITSFIQKENLDRRAYDRLKISLKATVQLLDVSDRAEKKPFKITLDDISPDGVSYTSRIGNEEELNQLLEHHLALQIEYPTSEGEQKVVKRGKIVAAYLLPFGNSAIHIKFQTLLENQIVDAIKNFKRDD